MTPTRRLLARLRDTMASSGGDLGVVVRLVAAEMVAEVCSLYALRPGDMLELRATEGLRPDSVGRTRLRVGEGIVGTVAATGKPLNLPDAPNHPAYAYRAETGEERFVSMLAVPVRRAGRTLGVLAVQNRAVRRYGDDEVEVLETVAMLLAEGLAAGGAHDGAEEGLGATLSRQYDGDRLAPGIAVGPIVLHGVAATPKHLLADDPALETRRLEAALETMRRDLDRLIEEQGPAGEESREVLQATRLVAADSGWLRRVSEAIRTGLSAEAAVHRVGGELRDRMRRIVDPILRERMADLEDLAARLLDALSGPATDATSQDRVPAGSILLARRLGPAQLLGWHARGVAAVLIEEGSTAGHAAILARALGLPALGGARGALESVEPGDHAILDGDGGTFILRPEGDVRRAYERALEARAQRLVGWTALRHAPSVSADGTKLRLMLNVGLALELDRIEATGAAGIGLFRSEISVLARGAMPNFDEQVALYKNVLDHAGERPVVFRTLDLGGDKIMPDAARSTEENPAMGWRSLRIGLDRPAVLRRQIKALLIAADGRPLTIMFPMVSTVQEFRAARRITLAEAVRLGRAAESLSIGVMLEVPALLFQLPALLREVAFLSIGSNDLMQFLFAADRGTPSVASRYDMLSAPMLEVLGSVVAAAAAAGVPLSLCGESASKPLEAITLAAIGITTLSMPATSLFPVKAALAATDLGAFRRVLDRLRATADGGHSLREPLTQWAREHHVPV